MIIRLEIRNNLALKSKGINKIVIDKISMFNILLGRNGNGKTTLLGEISPLPPDNAEYDENGYKEIEYTFQNKHYRLVSNTGKKSTHYFYFNGKNLNTGMTLRVQLELVKQHFNITPEIKNVISGIDGADLFSSLSLPRRKSVLMAINPSDTTLILKVYDALRSTHNQTKGALKHQRQRLAAELSRQKSINAVPIEELRYEIKFLDGEIKNALFAHGVLSTVTDPDLRPYIKKLDNILIDILNVKHQVEHPISWYEQAIEKSQRFIQTDKLHEATLIAFINDVSDKINSVNPDQSMSIGEYEAKINELRGIVSSLEHELAGANQLIDQHTFFQDEVYQSRSLIRELPAFIERLSVLSITPDDEMSAPEFTRLLEARKRYTSEVDVLDREIQKARHTLRHYSQADSVKCPECQHGFKLGFENFDSAQLKILIDKMHTNKEGREEKLKYVTDKIEINEPWYYSMLELMRFIRCTRNAPVFSSIIKHYRVGKKENPSLINILNTIVERDNLKVKIAEVKQNLQTTEGSYRLINESDIHTLYQYLETLNRNLSETQRRVSRRQRDLRTWEKALQTIKTERLLITTYGVYFDEFFNLLVEKGKFVIKEAIEERINTLTPKKEQLMTDIIRSESLTSVVNAIQEQVNELERKEKHLAYLIDKLSPTKGFIGHLMLDFLNAFCANVNATIGKVWTEPLTLLSPGVEENDLDYKFKVVTTNVKKPITDIRKCSGGEKDIINFSIRAVLLRYLGQQSGLPFVMDEIGATFDELHRQRFSHYISTENRIGTLPQTFMVSHYISQYGAFKNNEVKMIVLNTRGLTTPDHANENVIIG